MTRTALPRRRFLTLVLGMASVSVLAACGQASAPSTASAPTSAAAAPTSAPQPTSAPPPATAPPATAQAASTAIPAATSAGAAEQISLTIHGRDTLIDNIYSGVAKDYMAKHPNVKVTYERTPGQEYAQKQLIMSAAGTSGDAYWWCAPCIFGQLALSGVFVDHAPLAQATKFDLGALFPQAVRGATIKGKLYGLPHAVHAGAVGLIVNKTLFQKDGVALPKAEWTNEAHPGWTNWTFDDFQKTAIAMTKRDANRTVQWGFEISHQYFDLTGVFRSWGAEFMSKDGTKNLYESPDMLAAITYWADLYNKYKVSPTSAENPSGGPDLMASGKIAMQMAAIYNLQGAREKFKNFEWQVIPAARGKGGVDNMFFFDGWSVLTTSKSPATTFDFLSGIASFDLGLSQAKLGGVPGSEKAIWQDKTLIADPNFQVFAKIQENVSDFLELANWRTAEHYQASDKGLDPLFNGESTDVLKVVTDTNRAMQAIMDKPAAGLKAAADCVPCGLVM